MSHRLRVRETISGGVRISHATVGDGPTVLLLHGFPETRESWQLQVPALIEAGFRVVLVDLRGYGESDRPRRGYDLDTLAADISAVIDDLGAERVSVVGHDWGGAVTWHLAARRPWRVERVVVLDCPHPVIMQRALLDNPRQRRRSWYMFFFQLPLLPELWLSKNDGANLSRMFREPDLGGAPASLVEAERRALLEPGALRPALAYYRENLRAGLSDLALRRSPRYPPIQLPVTLIWGERDSCLGTELIDGTQHLAPRLDVHVVPGAGHFVHQERPADVNRLLLSALRP